MEIRGSCKFRSCSGFYSRHVSGQFQSLYGPRVSSLLLGWKETQNKNKKTNQTRVLTQRPRLEWWYLMLQPEQMQCWAGLHIEILNFLIAKKLKHNKIRRKVFISYMEEKALLSPGEWMLLQNKKQRWPANIWKESDLHYLPILWKFFEITNFGFPNWLLGLSKFFWFCF